MLFSEIKDFLTVYNNHKNDTLPIKTAYKFVKISNELKVDQAFYEDRLSNIIREFSLKDDKGDMVRSDDGTSIKIAPGKEAACKAALEELYTLEVSTPDIKFTIDELEGLSFTCDELSILMRWIQE